MSNTHPSSQPLVGLRENSEPVACLLTAFARHLCGLFEIAPIAYLHNVPTGHEGPDGSTGYPILAARSHLLAARDIISMCDWRHPGLEAMQRLITEFEQYTLTLRSMADYRTAPASQLATTVRSLASHFWSVEAILAEVTKKCGVHVSLLGRIEKDRDYYDRFANNLAEAFQNARGTGRE